MTNATKIGRALAVFEKGDFLPILALVIAVQGTVLISQSVAALLLDTAAIGRIRVFESMISIGVLVAGFGAPALAIREMASRDNAERRGEVLRDLLLLPVFGAIIICVAALIAKSVGATWILPISNVLFASSLLLVAINLVRLGSAVAQGLVIVRHVYRWVILGSIVAVAFQITGASTGSLTGWIVGRLMGELALLCCMVFAMYYRFPPIYWRQPLHLAALFNTMTRATIINAGLIIRMLADASPILLLGGIIEILRPLNSDADDVGSFGIATLLLTAALLPISVMSQRALPLITGTSGDEQNLMIARFNHRMLSAGFVIALGLLAILIVLYMFDAGKFSTALLAAMGLMTVVPMKALASAIGTVMLANGELKMPVWITMAELITILLIFAYVQQFDSVWVAVLSVFTGSALSLVAMTAFRSARYRIS